MLIICASYGLLTLSSSWQPVFLPVYPKYLLTTWMMNCSEILTAVDINFTGFTYLYPIRSFSLKSRITFGSLKLWSLESVY